MFKKFLGELPSGASRNQYDQHVREQLNEQVGRIPNGEQVPLEVGSLAASAGGETSLGDGEPVEAHRAAEAPSTTAEAKRLLSKLKATSTTVAAEPKRLGTKPKLPDHLLKQERRDTYRHDENGRVMNKYRKRKNNGNLHYKVRRKKERILQKNYREKTNHRYVKAYNASQWRKYLQNRSYALAVARRKGYPLDTYYQLTFDEWLRLWSDLEPVWHEGGFTDAISLQGIPLKTNGVCTWASRIDREKPYTLDNMCIKYKYKPIPRKGKDEPKGN